MSCKFVDHIVHIQTYSSSMNYFTRSNVAGCMSTSPHLITAPLGRRSRSTYWRDEATIPRPPDCSVTRGWTETQAHTFHLFLVRPTVSCTCASSVASHTHRTVVHPNMWPKHLLRPLSQWQWSRATYVLGVEHERPSYSGSAGNPTRAWRERGWGQRGVEKQSQRKEQNR